MRIKDDQQRAIEFVSGLAFEGGWKPERFGEHLPDVDVSLANSEEQRIVVGIATDLVAASGPDIDGVDPRNANGQSPNCGMTYASSIDGGLTAALAATDSRAASRTRSLKKKRPSS